MDIGIIILAISVLCVGAILAGAAGQKIDAPILLVFLLVGMLAGREGPGGISLDATQAMLVWGSAALAAILFEGGLRTEPKVFDLGAAPGLSLALGGTLITALIVAPFAHWAFDLDWTAALLLGAIVSSTDAAAVFALAATGLKLPERVVAVLEVESGLNDPLAILLVVGLSTSLAIAPMGPGDWAGTLIAKLVIGAAVGIAIGAYTPRLVRGLALPSGLLAILLAALGFMAFGIAETLGGSGFLAIYLCGLVLGRRAPALADRAGSVMDGLAWLAQTGLFLLLGLLVTPSHLASFALPAFGLSLALIFLARPLAVLISLLPFKFRPRDMGFVAWTGLRGATPVYLGLLPAALGVPNGNLYLSAAAVVVLLSLVIQGWTAPVVGRALKLTETDQEPVDRGETLARLGAVGASIAVGAWFAVILSPEIEQDMMLPETMEELIAGLEESAMTPAAFPQGFADQPPEVRRPIFVGTVSAVMEDVNQQVIADRDRLTLLDEIFANRGRLTLEEEAEVGTIARRYELDFALPAELLARIDVVPPRLATAQAALASGWGSSKQLRANNAIFGLKIEEGYPSLFEAAQDLATLYAAHPDFGELREARAAAREAGETPQAEELVSRVGAFAGDGPAYIAQVREVLASPLLQENPQTEG